MNELSALIKKARKVIPDAIKDASVQTLGAAVEYSPYLSGQLKASARIGLNSPDTSKVTAPVYGPDAVAGSASAAASISKGKAPGGVSGYKPGDTVYISNSHDYVVEQEYEAGHLMYTRAAAEFPAYLDRAVNAAK